MKGTKKTGAKRAISLLMALLAGTSPMLMSGCGDNDTSNQTKITAHLFYAGCGSTWLEEAIANFERMVADKSYEDGKTGVDIELEKTEENQIQHIAASGFNMFFDEGHQTVKGLSQAGLALNLDDVYSAYSDTRDGVELTLEDKIPAEYRGAMKGADGHYYALPSYSWTPGLSYDKTLFDSLNTYFASPDETNSVLVTTKYGSANFIKNASAKKSCGNDGVFGTYDDGLPTTLQEFLILCAALKQRSVTDVINVAGSVLHYPNYLITALWAALSGSDMFKTAAYSFDGELEVVTGNYKSENLFDGIDYVKAPETKTVTVTEQTGYYGYDSVYRYYATAMIEVLQKEGFFSSDSNDKTNDNMMAQGNFILNGLGEIPKKAMFIDGNYWFNEAEEFGGYFESYTEISGNEEREVAWMPLPTKIYMKDMVTGTENARELTYTDTSNALVVVNGNIADQTGKVNAIKDFLKYYYSDANLINCSKKNGLKLAYIDYEIPESELETMSGWRKNLLQAGNSYKTVYSYHDNKTLNAHMNDRFALHSLQQVYRPTYNGVSYMSAYVAMRNGATAKDCFENTRLTATAWEGIYVGE